MPLDTFICGTCMVSFNDIEQFILHKNGVCTKPENSNDGQVAMETTQVTMEMETSAAVGTVTSLVEMNSAEEYTNIGATDEQGSPVTASLPGAESLIASSGAVFQGANQQRTVIILQGDLPHFNLENAEQVLAEVTQEPANIELLRSMYKQKGRPGRPKKTSQDTPSKRKQTEEIKEKNEPVIGEDGKLLCTRCKKTFTKERVFNAHKCLALSEYVDFSVKEGLTADPDDNHMPQDDIEDDGALDLDTKDSEYKLPYIPPKRHDPYKYKRRLKAELRGESSSSNDGYDDSTSVDNMAEKNVVGGADLEFGDESKGQFELTTVNSAPICEVEAGPDRDDSQASKDTDQVDSIPLQLTDEEKLAFEAALNVDLSGVDNMFRVHCIEQELNSNVSQLSRFSSNVLSLYSCNMCDKVFKSLSHMRFHVLIHTDIRPFKCIKCDYVSNSRGNLYTHMRKHTGQYYKCDFPKCKFHTVNKSHLIEHSMTHKGEKHKCELCRKMYNTQKSLMSHIRKYHDNSKGREYLATFMQGRDVRGSTVIHQCHVCNRKFKKKTDRDRHLFVHDIRDLPVVKHCELCDYSAARNKYLEKHFQKHRCIYRCCKCDTMFLSSLKLVEHLTTSHSDTTNTESWEKLFEESISHSLYLPEPDTVLPQEEKNLVNLPSELSQSGLYQMKLQNSGEDDLSNKLIDEADSFINKLPAVTVEQTNSAEKSTDHDASLDSSVEMDHGYTDIANEEVETQTVGDNQETQSDDKSDEKPAVGSEPSAEENEKKSSEFSAKNGQLTSAEDTETTTVIEETSLTDEEVLGTKSNSLDCQTLIEKLGFLPMTLQIFQKMRDTFGSEECEYCGRLFFSRMDYEPHVRTHTGDRPHVCQTCGFLAITPDNLKRHMDKEHEHKTFSCQECTYVATSRTQLWNHTMKHKGLKGLECPQCQEQFDSIKELKSHAQVAHPNSSTEELNKILSYKHKTQGKLGRRSYKCPYCDKIFLRASSELQKHMWIHENVKPFKCPICPYACRSKNNLQAHMLRHTKDKPFSCGDCGKAYKSKTALRWHVRSHDGKLFKCDKCPYEATQRSHLKRHMETHNVMKKYVCGECKFSANTLGFLKVHYARFHKDVNVNNLPSMGSAPIEIAQDVNTFKCISCDYLFGNVSDLKRHLRTRHHVNIQDIQQVQHGQGNVSEVQVVQVEESGQQHVAMEVAEGTESQIVTDGTLDEKTASAVNILQQIIGLSQNGGFPVTQNEDGTSILQVNPETIIVQQQDGSQMYVSAENTTDLEGNQYVIQYIPQTEEVTEGTVDLVEVQGEFQPEIVETQTLCETQTLGEVQTEIVTTT